MHVPKIREAGGGALWVILGLLILTGSSCASRCEVAEDLLARAIEVTRDLIILTVKAEGAVASFCPATLEEEATPCLKAEKWLAEVSLKLEQGRLLVDRTQDAVAVVCAVATTAVGKHELRKRAREYDLQGLEAEVERAEAELRNLHIVAEVGL